VIVSLIAAMSENRVIGRDGALPWRLPLDMRHFKTLTTGHAVIMGRKTFETLPAALPHRRNIVLTRDRSYRPDGAEVVASLDDALQLAADDDEVFVAGGGDVYRLALPRADRLYLTLVHVTVDGDTHFPTVDDSAWRLVSDERHDCDERHAHAFSFRFYERGETRDGRHGTP
jgi:dihydrofolate reductase